MGDVLCRFIDVEGNVIDHLINDRVIVFDPRKLGNVRKVVLESGGWQKYDAIKGAMQLLRPHVLITDELVAERSVAAAK